MPNVNLFPFPILRHFSRATDVLIRNSFFCTSIINNSDIHRSSVIEHERDITRVVVVVEAVLVLLITVLYCT